MFHGEGQGTGRVRRGYGCHDDMGGRRPRGRQPRRGTRGGESAAERVALSAFEAVQSTRSAVLPALDLLSNQEAELGRQSQELAARLDKVETYLCSEEFRRPWVNLQNQGEQGKRVDAALQGLTQIASLHDGEIGNIRAHLQQAEAQEQQWKSGFEAELQLGLEKRFDEARSTSELRLAGFSVLLEALPPRIRLCEDHVMALEKNQNDLAKRTEDIQSKLGQPTEEIVALMAQVRTMSGYTEAISQRDETIALLKGQIEAQQSELRQVQSRLAELQQLVQTLPPAQTMATWNEGLN